MHNELGAAGDPCNTNGTWAVLTVLSQCSQLQVLGEEWRKIALDYQAKIHRVAIIILKAIFIGLGRDESIIDEVQTKSHSFSE